MKNLNLPWSKLFFHSTLCVCLTVGIGRFALANVVGPDMQNFNSSPDGLDFVTVQSSETLKPGYWNFGLFLNHATGTLPKFPQDGSNRLSHSFSDSLVGMDLNLAVGVLSRWTLAVSFPQLITQSVKDSAGSAQGKIPKTGPTEIRPLVKYHIMGNSRGGVAALVSTGINMVENNPYTGLGAPPIVNLEMAFDGSKGPVSAGLNIGYRHRTPGAALSGAPVDPLGSQWIASIAGSLLVTSIKSRVIAEVFGSAPIKSTTNRSDRLLSSAEGLLGIKHMATHSIAIHGGLGREITQGIASPDFRIYAGLNYSIGPSDEKLKKESRVKRTPSKKDKQKVPDYVHEESDDQILTDIIPEKSTPMPGEETFVINNVFFAFDRDSLVTTGGREILQRLAVYLMKAPEFSHLQIEGHTDFIGSEIYNNDLSFRRSYQLKRYLVEVLKIDERRISVVGYGESRPIEDNGNFQGRQSNRRAEFKITR